MVGTGDLARALPRRLSLLGGEVVETQGDAFGGAPIVDEDERRAVLAYQTQKLRIDRRPDAAPRGFAARHSVQLDGLVRLDHGFHGHVDAQVDRLAHAGVDDRAPARGTDEIARHLFQRPLGGGQPDALDIAARLLGQPLQRHRQVRAALGLGDGVDLVQDHPLRAGEQPACLRREHEVQRLGRRDEDVGRRAQHGRPLLLRRVAGAHRDRDVGADAAQRRAQVALHVVAQRLERRDVDEPQRSLLRVRGRRFRDEPVERPQEGGEGLAGPGGRRDERVGAGGDGRPSLHLRRRGLRERPREPLTHARRERRERGMCIVIHVLGSASRFRIACGHPVPSQCPSSPDYHPHDGPHGNHDDAAM